MNDYYAEEIYPWTVPILLPVAQISLTASVYTTVVTCFDRYIAICRPALLGKASSKEIATLISKTLYRLESNHFAGILGVLTHKTAWD